MPSRKENSLVCWKSDVDYSAVLAERLANNIFGGLKREIANEEGISRGVLGVTILLSSALCAVLWCGLVTRSGEVDIGLTTINERTLLGSESGSSRCRAGELDVSETLGAARVSVGQDIGTCDLTELLELSHKPLIVDVPAEVTDKQVLGSSVFDFCLGLGLLCGLNGLILGLALLVWCLGLAVTVAGIGSIVVIVVT
jgi:hypothetical protein